MENINIQVLDFFEKKAEEMHNPHQRDIMDIDLVWWSEVNDIELALHQEAPEGDVPKFSSRRAAVRVTH